MKMLRLGQLMRNDEAGATEKELPQNSDNSLTASLETRFEVSAYPCFVILNLISGYGTNVVLSKTNKCR